MATLTVFLQQLDTEVVRCNRELAQKVGTISEKLFIKIVDRTPIDTGRAKASWTINLGSADFTIAADITRQAKISANDARARALRQLTTLANMTRIQDIHIANGNEYISFLENGSSTQAPSGMVALSIAEIETTRL